MARKRSGRALSGSQKAATLMVSLGPDVASQVYGSLDDDSIEQITIAVANLGTVDQDQSAQVIEEFYHTCMAKQYMGSGGIGTAREILEKALGPGKAMDIIEGLQGMLQGTPFDFLKKVAPEHILNFVQNEHPQTIALVLANLEYEQSAEVLAALSPQIQTEVALRVATMDQTAPEIVNEVERVLERKIAKVLSSEFMSAGGVDALAEVLNRVDRATEKRIMDSVTDENQELAQEIRKRMFTFDDILSLDDRAIQIVVGEIDPKELALALKGADGEVAKKFFSNVSSRGAENIKDEIDFMGPVRVKQVEDAQQRIIGILRQLEETGKININRDGTEDMVA